MKQVGILYRQQTPTPMMTSDRKPGLQRGKPMQENEVLHFRVTPRDIDLFQKLIECRAMSTPQIEAAFYSPSSRSRCLLRLKFLYKAGYIGRIEQPCLLSEGRKPFIYVPKLKAIQLVAQRDGIGLDEIGWDGKELSAGYPFLSHMLAITDLNVAFTRAAQRSGFTIETWLNELTLKRKHMIDRVEIEGPRGATQKAAVVPDAYIVLNAEGHTYNFFCELDMGTEIGQASTWGRRDIARKCFAYRYYMTPVPPETPSLYQKRYGTNKGRILFVTTSQKRMLMLKEVCEKCGGRARFWFAVQSDLLTNDPFTDKIWRKAGTSNEETFTLIW
jgi:hypothetical protein